jgi:hypothetical protein
LATAGNDGVGEAAKDGGGDWSLGGGAAQVATADEGAVAGGEGGSGEQGIEGSDAEEELGVESAPEEGPLGNKRVSDAETQETVVKKMLPQLLALLPKKVRDARLVSLARCTLVPA